VGERKWSNGFLSNMQTLVIGRHEAASVMLSNTSEVMPESLEFSRDMAFLGRQLLWLLPHLVATIAHSSCFFRIQDSQLHFRDQNLATLATSRRWTSDSAETSLSLWNTTPEPLQHFLASQSGSFVNVMRRPLQTSFYSTLRTASSWLHCSTL